MVTYYTLLRQIRFRANTSPGAALIWEQMAMKKTGKTRFLSVGKNLVLSGLLSMATLPVAALQVPSRIDEATAKPLDEAPLSSVSPSSPTAEASLTAHLRMQAGQIERLNRLYNDYISRRVKEEAHIQDWQSQLQQAQSPASYDERKATRLLRDISNAEQKVATAFLASRAQALKTLNPVQRAQLEAMSTDSRMKLHHDRYYQLLLLGVEDIWRAPAETRTERRMSESRAHNRRPARYKGNGSYGVYGGYGYGGPQYGVYGNYGQGAIGVHAGIGRGGPSFGIGIGRVFGGWYR